MNFLKSS
jgi:hypothetical protein